MYAPSPTTLTQTLLNAKHSAELARIDLHLAKQEADESLRLEQHILTEWEKLPKEEKNILAHSRAVRKAQIEWERIQVGWLERALEIRVEVVEELELQLRNVGRWGCEQYPFLLDSPPTP